MQQIILSNDQHEFRFSALNSTLKNLINNFGKQ